MATLGFDTGDSEELLLESETYHQEEFLEIEVDLRLSS